MPELLLEDQISLGRFARVIAFSPGDADLLLTQPSVCPVEIAEFPGYNGGAVDPELREHLHQLMKSETADVSVEWDFDSRRPAS